LEVQYQQRGIAVRTKLARRGRRILQLLALLPIILPAFLTLARVTPAFAGTDDYPAVWRNAAPDTLVDSWGEFNRECTSFAAFRLSSRNGFTMPFHDNATNWGPDASSRGYPVDMKPAVGSIAWWSSGHVAWVEEVNGSNVTIEEYNFNFTHNYSERTIAASSVSGYIHFNDIVPSALVRPVVTSDGHIQLFEVTGGVVEQNWYSPATGATGNWASAAGMPAGVHATGNPAVVPRSGQQVIDVFVGSSDGLIRETWYNWGTGAWGGWIAISGATFTADPQAVATADGHDQIFADANGVVEQNWFSPATGATGNWKTI